MGRIDENRPLNPPASGEPGQIGPYCRHKHHPPAKEHSVLPPSHGQPAVAFLWSFPLATGLATFVFLIYFYSKYKSMSQQDLTAPVDRVRVSKREKFSRAYQVLQDEETERNITGYTFSAELIQGGRLVLSLTESAGISRPQASTVEVSLNTVQIGELNPNTYSLYLFGVRGGEREMFVQILMEVVA